MRFLDLPDVLTDAGLRVQTQPGWEQRGSSAFDPHVLLAHHTASSASGGNIPSLGTVTNGRPDLPGPLCQVLLGRDGLCVVVASGRANHAGPGSWRGWYGNTAAWGIEAENDGRGEPWPAEQMDAYHACAAALISRSGGTAADVCGHKEWATPPGRKIDPTFDMGAFRAAVADVLAGAGPTPIPTYKPPEDDTVTQLWQEQDKDGRAALVSTDGNGMTAFQVNSAKAFDRGRFFRVAGYERVTVTRAQFDTMRAQAIQSGGFYGLNGEPKPKP